MKRTVLIFIVSALVLGTTALWMFTAGNDLKPFDLLTVGVIFLVVVFALVLGFKRIGSAKRGEPAEDELSKSILQKTAAWSYYISLYMWVAMIYIKDRVKLDTEEVLGAGILAMAVIFGLSWVFIYFRGLKNE